MATHNMVALVPMRYGGKQLKAGDTFTAEGTHARLLAAIKKAKLNDSPSEEAKPAAKPAPAPKPMAKTLAQPVAKPAAPAQTTEPAPASTAVPGMTTKTYKTRDLDPE